MIQSHSQDPDVATAARQAFGVIDQVLTDLPPADKFDYGGHELRLGEYGVCVDCTRPIAEAQQAEAALRHRAEHAPDPEIREHIDLAADLLKLEAEAATVRAELHNGIGSEAIVNRLLRFQYDRVIHDDYNHSHHPEATS